MTQATQRANLIGIFCAIGASVFFSVNDMAIKFLSGDYALHQVILIRSTIGMVILMAFIIPLEGGFQALKTRRPVIHLARGLCVVFANMTFFLGLAAMPLAEAVAIFFIAPLVITAFSVIFLGEKVGPHRWAAVGVGLIGVLVMLRPGSSAFQPAALLPLVAAVAYAMLHILTRKIGIAEKAATMSFYIQVTFITVSAAMGLAFGNGQFAGSDDPSLDFLFRAWSMPASTDFLLFTVIGTCSALGGYLISQAYRLAEAGLAAPFEYIAMPMAIAWGVVVFGEWPDAVAWIGISLIIIGGLYTVWRESVQHRRVTIDQPARR
ncbi:MAG: DMT family transporter [Rhodobacteraceae bacterium]|nr:DMT family transporter [Paracoccaceae bacterium]